MPNIFISYRRDDSPANARLLYERLRSSFAADDVFMDVEGIAAGAEWRRVLVEKISNAAVVLVVIGRQWLARNGHGRRRLDDPEDFVRWEVSEALARGKRVIPVLVDGASLPRADELPEPLQALPGRQWRQITHANFDKDIEALTEALSGTRVIDLVARLKGLLGMAKAAAILVPVVGVALLAFAWVSLFDLLGLDTRTASYTMLAGDVVFEPALSDRLAIVSFAPSPEETVKLSPARRGDYARLIDVLSAQGAKSIAFDILLRERSEFDAALLAAVRAARARGTAVFFGFDQITAGEPAAFPGLRETASALGYVCVGEKLDEATLASAALFREGRAYPALPLLAAFGPVAVDSLTLDTQQLLVRDARDKTAAIPFSTTDVIEQADRDCPARSPGSRVARLIIKLSHRERLREPARRHPMAQVLDPASMNANAFADKIVLVGAEHPLDTLHTRMDADGAARYGFEFHVDAINALLTDNLVRPMPLSAQWLVMLVMILTAVGYRLWRLGKPSRFDLLAPLAAGLIYFVLAVVAYAEFNVLADGVYHLTAFFVTWWALGVLERRWRRGTT